MPFHWTVFRCSRCRGDIAVRSRRRNFMERYLLALFGLRPVRCAKCRRRYYRLRSVTVSEHRGHGQAGTAA